MQNQAPVEDTGVGDKTMRSAILYVFGVGIVLTVGSAIVHSQSALSVAIGAMIATANLIVFAKIGRALISQKGRTAPWTLIAIIKLVVLFGGIWLLLQSKRVSGLAIAVGYGALPLGITLAGLLGPKPKDYDDNVET